MSIAAPEPVRGDRVDRVGMVASSLCAAHCAVSAVLPAVLGSLGLGFLLGHEAEWVFTVIAITFAAGALVLGWRRHRSTRVVLLLALGIAGLLVSRELEEGSAHHSQPPVGTSAEPSAGSLAEIERSPEHRSSASDPAEAPHFAGTAVGVLSGLLLIGGHLLNLRAMRRCRTECV